MVDPLYRFTNCSPGEWPYLASHRALAGNGRPSTHQRRHLLHLQALAAERPGRGRQRHAVVRAPQRGVAAQEEPGDFGFVAHAGVPRMFELEKL